jgi:hypothetical protein
VKKVLSLVVALSVAALFSSVTLAGADCQYHKTQAAASANDTSKEVAQAPAPDKTDVAQVQAAQVSQPKSTLEQKK